MAGEGSEFMGLDDPRLLEFIRGGAGTQTQSGASVNAKTALRNTTVLRCVSLISFSVGMLPLHLHRKEDSTKASDHPLFRLLHRRPNAWQTAFEFRSLMQQRALIDGDAFALKVMSGRRVIQLVPIANARVTVKQRADWSLEYRVRRDGQGEAVYSGREIFHLRYGMSEDGITGLSLVRQAAEAIGLALQAERASARLFRQGVIAGQVLRHPGKLSPEAFERLRDSMAEHEGASNAHRTKILEEGMELDGGGMSGRDSEATAQRKLQIEEIARPFGVPRPLLAVDDTSWGSGIDVLGQFFVRYGLSPWFEAWQQAIERDLLTEAEQEIYEAKFNAGALLRGSMKDQADFFAKGLGAGGHQPFLEVDEVRGWLDLPHSDNLPPRLSAATHPKGETDEPPQAA
ncbi:phage portal protein [Pseudoroseicyclus sp. H15]